MGRQTSRISGTPRLVPWWFLVILISIFLWGIAYVALHFV